MPQTEIIYTSSEPVDIGPAAEVVVRKIDPVPPPGPKSFEEAVNAIHKRDGEPRCNAMSKAASEFPALLEKYQCEGIKLVEEARPEPIRKADAVMAIRSRDGCSNIEAMGRAADEHPAELKAYREA
jgi:hypothetical protein